MTRPEESVTVAQRHLAGAQSALPTGEGERSEYRRRLGVREQQCGSLEALLRGLHTCLVNHTSLVDPLVR